MNQPDLFTADAMTIARQNFFAELKAGSTRDCPCCKRHAQIYRRQVHSGIAAALIRLYRQTAPGDYAHISKITHGSTGFDIPIARFWGLVEPQTNTDEKKKTSGEWRLTPFGRLYVENKHEIQKYCYLFDNRALGFDGPLVNIRSAAQDVFDYQKLMNDGITKEQQL